MPLPALKLYSAADFALATVTDDNSKRLDQALGYLQTSAEGYNLVHELASDASLRIDIPNKENSRNVFNYQSNTIVWQPGWALAVKGDDGRAIGQRSSAMMLALIGAQAVDAKRRVSPNGTLDTKGYSSDAEQAPAKRVNVIAAQLGEPQLHRYYVFDDDWVRTNDPTTSAVVKNKDTRLGFRTQTITSQTPRFPVTITYGFRDAKYAESYLISVDQINGKVPRDQYAARQVLQGAGMKPDIQLTLNRPQQFREHHTKATEISAATQALNALDALLQDPVKTEAPKMEVALSEMGLGFTGLTARLPLSEPAQLRHLTARNLKVLGKATAEQMLKLDQAIDYLKSSPSATSILQTAANNPNLFLVFNADQKIRQVHAAGKDFIEWDPATTVTVQRDNNDGEASAAWALLHELAHTTDPNRALNIAVSNLPGYTNAAEAYAVAKEKNVGSELGEPSRRTYEDIGAIGVQNNPTTRTFTKFDGPNNILRQMVTKTGFVGSESIVVTQDFDSYGKPVSVVTDVDNGLGYRTQTVSNHVQGTAVSITYGYRGEGSTTPYVIGVDAINGKVPQDPNAAKSLMREIGITPSIQLEATRLIASDLSAAIRLNDSPATVEHAINAGPIRKGLDAPTLLR